MENLHEKQAPIETDDPANLIPFDDCIIAYYRLLVNKRALHLHDVIGCRLGLAWRGLRLVFATPILRKRPHKAVGGMMVHRPAWRKTTALTVHPIRELPESACFATLTLHCLFPDFPIIPDFHRLIIVTLFSVSVILARFRNVSSALQGRKPLFFPEFPNAITAKVAFELQFIPRQRVTIRIG